MENPTRGMTVESGCGMSDETFARTIDNLLKMKPKPHKGDGDQEKGRENPAPSKTDRSKNG